MLPLGKEVIGKVEERDREEGEGERERNEGGRRRETACSYLPLERAESPTTRAKHPSLFPSPPTQTLHSHWWLEANEHEQGLGNCSLEGTGGKFSPVSIETFIICWDGIHFHFIC